MRIVKPNRTNGHVAEAGHVLLMKLYYYKKYSIIRTCYKCLAINKYLLIILLDINARVSIPACQVQELRVTTVQLILS